MKEQALIQAALEARERAYCPYSEFKVGAAVLSEEERIFDGCNVENASYGMTRCAEQVALLKGVSEGARRFKMIAIASQTEPPVGPCGMCRQMLIEFCDPELLILLVNPAGSLRRFRLRDLQPEGFGPQQLLQSLKL